MPPGNQSATLGKPSLKARLEAYYSLVAPDLLASPTEWRNKFDQIYEKYGGTLSGEKKLASKLTKKYGTAVRLLLPIESDKIQKHPQTQKGPGDDDSEHEESWFGLRPHETGSGDLSFLSDRFDPVAALNTSESEVMKQNPWIAECPRLDIVGQFVLHLPQGDPMRKEPPRGRKRAFSNPAEEAQKKARELHPFEAVAQSLETGPWSQLHRFRRQRVRIVIRYVNAIRGTLTGTLLAFDKHANMILKNAEEVYSPRPIDDGSRSSVDLELERRKNLKEICSVSPNYKSNKWNVRRRSMKNLLVRGDNVVVISRAEDEQNISSSRYIKKTNCKKVELTGK